MCVCPEHKQLHIPLLCNSLIYVGSYTEAKQYPLSQLVYQRRALELEQLDCDGFLF